MKVYLTQPIAEGALIDERALVAALAQGRIAGAALDVHEHEPRIAVDNIRAVAHGERPSNCCNPAIYAAPSLEGA